VRTRDRHLEADGNDWGWPCARERAGSRTQDRRSPGGLNEREPTPAGPRGALRRRQAGRRHHDGTRRRPVAGNGWPSFGRTSSRGSRGRSSRTTARASAALCADFSKRYRQILLSKMPDERPPTTNSILPSAW